MDNNAAAANTDTWPPSAPGSWAAVAAFGAHLLALAVPLALLQVFDRILPQAAAGTLVVLCAGLLVFVALEVALRLARAALLGWAAARAEHRLRMAAVDHLLRCDLAAYERVAPGTQLDRFAAIGRLGAQSAQDAGSPAVHAAILLLYLGALAWVAPPLAPVPLAGALAALVLGACMGQAVLRHAADRTAADARRLSFLVEVLRAIETVKAMAIEGPMRRRHDRLLRGGAVPAHDLALSGGVAVAVNAALAGLTMLATTTCGALLVMDGALTLGGMAAGLLLAGRAMPPAMQLQLQLRRGARAAQWRAEAAAVFRIPAAPVSPSDAPSLAPLNRLTLAAATILAPGLPTDPGAGAEQPATASRPLLHDVTLSVEVGETLAITGPSGSGKSTLLWVLAGLVRPASGRLLLDGLDAAGIAPATLRRQVALVPQQPVLLRGTLRENLTRFDPALEEEALEIARALRLDRALAEQPGGLDLTLGGGPATPLPAALARGITLVAALAGRPRVILFDEANGGLDRATDAALLAWLRSRRPDVALVLVTHRPSYLALAERRLTITEGRLVPASMVPA